MLKREIAYTDYNGVERKESYYFNLTVAEVTVMQMSEAGGYAEMLQRIIDSRDGATIMRTIEEFILKSYGEKSPDGRQFIKDEKLSNAFKQTPAYSILFMELVTDAKAAADFVNGVIPKAAPKAELSPNATPALN